MSSKENWFKAMLLAGAACELIVALPAQAQQADANAEEGNEQAQESRIIVTGSRILRPDYSATSPIVSVDSAVIEESSAINLEANLNKLPQFSPALTQFDTAEIQPNANTTPGVSTVSLRQLGSNRNLVLLDGRRATPINGTGVIDINSIPSAAIERVEIITGGASSTYGADAVGGVVNFIMKDDFTGVDFDGQVSFSPQGGGEEYRVSSLVGANLDGGRGHVMLGMEYYKREQLLRQQRDAYQKSRADPTVRGEEFFLADNYISTAGNNPFGSDALADAFPDASVAIPNTGIYFNQDGSLWVNTSTTVDGTYYPLLLNYQGGFDDGKKILDTGLMEQDNPDRILSAPQERYSFFAKGEYEINDWVNFIGQAYFARTQTKSVSFNTVLLSSTGQEIPYDDNIYAGSLLGDGVNTNPDFMAGGAYDLNCPATGGCTNKQAFPVPDNIAALLNSRDDPHAPWVANYSLQNFGRRGTENFNNTFQLQMGFEGHIPGTDLTWDVVASHGETIAKTNLTGLVSLDRFREIVLSPNYGYNFATVGNNGNRYGASASCATGLSPFIIDAAFSEDCDLATSADAQFENRIAQNLVEANLQGSLFELPAGELRFAVGAAYRKNSLKFTSDSSAFEGSSFYETINTFPQASSEGSTSVREIYGELLVPILADMPFAESLNLELGYRLSDYDSVGTTGTYKINGEWAPTRWLRFRGGYQKASRAPNLGELFTAKTASLAYASDGDPCSLANAVSPTVYGNYSANSGENSDASQVEALCRQMMGTAGAADYYIAGRTDYAVGGEYYTGLLAGASGLKEETAKTYTIGGVISDLSENPWLKRLRLSVDYYNIKLTDGISQQGINSVFRQCFSSIFNPTYQINDACERIERDPVTGEVDQVVINYSNEGAVETSGIDVQLDWGMTFRDAGINIPGTLSANVNFNYLDRFATTSDQVAIPLIDYAGTLGGGEVGTQAGSYRWKLFTRLNYSVGPATLALQWQHKPAVGSADSATNENSVIAGAPAYDLFNLTGSYRVNDGIKIRFGVDNLFDKAPPYIGYYTNDVVGDGTARFGRAANPYNASQYDVLGRRFYVGVNVSL